MTLAAPLIPPNAPFTPEQRAWLNGFFAGLLSLDGQAAPAAEARNGMAEAITPAAQAPGTEDGDGAPWHDQTLPIAERMTLAAGRPLWRRMMAAMGQQDCGQCGYDCEAYANAIFARQESRLNLCAPGGKETARTLKQLHAELEGATAEPKSDASSTNGHAVGAIALGYNRDKPVMATFVGHRRLNRPDSEKETHHVELDMSATGLTYEVGDSLGVWATNDPELVDQICAALGCSCDTEVGDGNGHSRSFRDALLHDVSLGTAPDALFDLMATLSADPSEKKNLHAMARGEDPDGDLETLDVLAALERFPQLRPSPRTLIAALDPLQPRLYSISSSPRVVPGKVHLTVDTVRYRINGRVRKGVASTLFAERTTPGAALPVYVQKAHAFMLPKDDATPIIMVGPGTGVAPFRAFLQERMASSATGKAWLFFGHQRRDCDFFYEDEFTGFLAQGTLTRLSTAWSRDGERKVYVQDRMREAGDALFGWLEEGAHLYVCGDAKRMAADVDRALHDIVAAHGRMSAAEARAYVSALARAGRYQKDVY